MVVAVIDFSKANNNNSNSKLNPLSSQLRRYIFEQLKLAASNPNVSSIILTGGGPHFSAGADLTEFGNAEKLLLSNNNNNNNNTTSGGGDGAPTLIDVVNQIEQSNKPIVAYITGTCLGGGLEVALACHYRIASYGTKLGLPEVHVGVIPGAGGTQRLPRLIGLPNALHMILSGSPVNSQKAKKLNLIDDIVGDYNVALQYAKWAETMPIPRLSETNIRESPAEAHVICHAAALSLPPHSLGNAGCLNALEACRFSMYDFETGMAKESQLFKETLLSEGGKARRHAFFAVRQAQKLQQQSAPSMAFPKQPTCAVIGAGTMGGGIALVLLHQNYKVIVVDVNQAALQKGQQMIHNTIHGRVKRQKLKGDIAKTLLENLKCTTSLDDDLAVRCDLVVEAVVENMKVKQSIFQTLDRVTKPSCLLLSNTSTLSIDEIMSVIRPERRKHTAGWHFFSPANVMKLVEIVVGKETSTGMVGLMQVLTKKIGKIGVVVGNCDGFCGNRMLKPYAAEMVLCLTENGNSIEEVDQALLNFGMALGPMQMGDLAGNDISYNVAKERGWVREPGGPVPQNRPARYTELADDMVSQLGRLGQKVGKGWYDYDPEIGRGRKGLHSQEMEDFIKYYVTGTDKLTESEIVERVLYPLVNEGFKILEEDIARCPSDIDVVYLYGYGWPVWKGGPMYWADHIVGLQNLLKSLEAFHDKFPQTDHYVPSELLKKCVASGVTVEEYYKRGMHRRPNSRL